MNIENQTVFDNEVADLPLWRNMEAHAVLKTVLAENCVSEEIFAQLVCAYRSHAHKQRMHGLTADFDDIFQSVTEDC